VYISDYKRKKHIHFLHIFFCPILLFPNKAFTFVSFNVFLNPGERAIERRTTLLEEGWGDTPCGVNMKMESCANKKYLKQLH